MTYRVIKDFIDLRDRCHEYKVGDVYPHTGEASVERVNVLMTPTPQRGALIEQVASTRKRKKEG